MNSKYILVLFTKAQKPTKGHTYAYCWKCFEIAENPIRYWEPSDKDGLSQWKTHTKTQHKLVKRLECPTCHIQFPSRMNQEHHLCTKANQSTEYFTRYTLKSEGDVLQSLSQKEATYEHTDPLSPSQLYHLCYEQKLAVENAYPGITRIGNPKTNLSLYGTTQVVDLYKSILLDKFHNGNYEPVIRIHRNIQIVNEYF